MSGRYLDGLNSEQRKKRPMASGVLDYFPDALAMVAYVSWVGNEKHNPGQPLHWARGKSTDHADCVIRHSATRDEADVVEIVRADGNKDWYALPHRALVAWRALADLQEYMERAFDLDLPPGARNE